MMGSVREYLDLLCVAALAVAALLLTTIAWPPFILPLRIPVGFGFLLLAPGYSLTAVTFHKRGDIDGTDRLALSVGLSVVIAPILALLLEATGYGIRSVPMAVGLTSFTLLALGLAAILRWRQPLSQRIFATHDLPRLKSLSWTGASLVLIAAGVVILTVALRPPVNATEFYLIDADRPGGQWVVRTMDGNYRLAFGINNQEGQATEFVVRLPQLEGQTIEVPSIADGDSWETTVTVEVPQTLFEGSRPVLTLELLRPVDDRPYRVVQFSLPRPSASPSSLAPISDALTKQ